MTKAQMIARLKVLAKILGRDVDTSGTQAELEQRLMEWEEEAASLPSTEANSSELKGVTSQKTSLCRQRAMGCGSECWRLAISWHSMDRAFLNRN